MRLFAVLGVLLVACSAARPPAIPLDTGDYQFTMSDLEHPSIPAVPIKAQLRGSYITLIAISNDFGHEAGQIIAEGELLWDSGCNAWAIGALNEKDRSGQSTCFEKLDLVNRHYAYW